MVVKTKEIGIVERENLLRKQKKVVWLDQIKQ